MANRIQEATPAERGLAAPTHAHLFPLKLTPFEQYLMLDDHPHQPMNAFMQITATTPFDRERLEEALLGACRRNPLYAARVVRRPKVWHWHLEEDLRPQLRCIRTQPPVVDGRIVPIDLTQEAGFRAWHHQQEDGRWRLLFQFHHACADGIGMRRFIIDVLVCYARLCAGQDDPIHGQLRFDKLDPDRLAMRDCIEHLTGTLPAVSLSGWQRLRNTYYFFCQPPAPLRGTRRTCIADPTAPADRPALVEMLPPEDSAAILARARSQEVGLNDLGLATLFHQCRLWHEQHSVRGPRQRIRLLMPFDIRSKADLRLSAANRLSYSFLGRTHQQCRDWPGLLTSVQAETQHIKDSRVYLDFLKALSLCQRRPRLFGWALQRLQNMATAVFTYGGDANRGITRFFPTDEQGYIRVGDALMEGGIGAPPVRANTNIAMGFGLSRGRVCVSLAWNRQVLTPDEAEMFLHGYIAALKAWSIHGTVNAVLNQ